MKTTTQAGKSGSCAANVQVVHSFVLDWRAEAAPDPSTGESHDRRQNISIANYKHGHNESSTARFTPNFTCVPLGPFRLRMAFSLVSPLPTNKLSLTMIMRSPAMSAESKTEPGGYYSYPQTYSRPFNNITVTNKQESSLIYLNI